MRITFKNADGIERDIGQAETMQEAYKIVNDFLADHNYKSYYTRTTGPCPNSEGPDYYWLDVGSWSEFFYIYLED